MTSYPPPSLPTGPKVAGDLPLVCWEQPPWGLLEQDFKALEKMMPLALGSTEAVFSFPLFSVSPPLSYPDFSSSAKRFQLSACWSIHPAGKLGIADNLWEFIDQSVCAAKCIYTRNNNIKCSTLSVQSLVMKPCENMERAEYSTGKSH